MQQTDAVTGGRKARTQLQQLLIPLYGLWGRAQTLAYNVKTIPSMVEELCDNDEKWTKVS